VILFHSARWIAKSLVAAKLARRILVQLSYAIGVAEPLSIFVDTYGTSTIKESEILNIIKKNFNLKPGIIVQQLGLHKPNGWNYQQTAAYGHFGREEVNYYLLCIYLLAILKYNY
jgi:S-adenosylmethionine synthetase